MDKINLNRNESLIFEWVEWWMKFNDIRNYISKWNWNGHSSLWINFLLKSIRKNDWFDKNFQTYSNTEFKSFTIFNIAVQSYELTYFNAFTPYY
jgi:hypothetical protein